MLRAAGCAVLLTLLVATGGPAASPLQRPTATTVVTVIQWVNAVERHTAGARDASVAIVQTWSPESRGRLNRAVGLFLKGLLGKGLVVASPEEKAIADLGRDTAQRFGVNVFLGRAAVLHSDAVILGPPGDLGIAPSRQPPGTKSLVVTSDGEYTGLIAANENWVLARSLIELVVPRPVHEPFVGVWYHATAAYMFRSGLFGEARTHLDRAGALLPDDVRILFDRACLFEMLGLPMSQSLLTNEDVIAMRLRQSGQRVLPGAPRMSATASLAGIPTEEAANAEAERLFRRALAVDGTFVEARVRLARLLSVGRRYADAEAELDTALTTSHDPAISFYAHLFAGRASKALGKDSVAARHYREALELFPAAQSALLAQSQLALQNADVPGALMPIRRLVSLPARQDASVDPWWQYHLGPGRDADARLGEMWNASRALGNR